jgi:septum formation protein
MRILLGSSSPRRKEILGGILGDLEITAPDVDETALPGETPPAYAMRISAAKATALSRKTAVLSCPWLLITCDTIVTLDSKIIGKPRDHDDAVGIIKTLSGRTHQVISAVTLWRDGAEQLTRAETSSIRFRNLDDGDIRVYLGKIHYMDKAGAYAVQEHGGSIIENITGSVTNVIGFPLTLFFGMAVELGITGELFPGVAALEKGKIY